MTLPQKPTPEYNLSHFSVDELTRLLQNTRGSQIPHKLNFVWALEWELEKRKGQDHEA